MGEEGKVVIWVTAIVFGSLALISIANFIWGK